MSESLFKKRSKKVANVRSVLAEDEEEGDGGDGVEPMDVSNVEVFKKPKKKKEKKGEPTKLSFGDDLEADDGEEFRVKKSSQSRKLKKQIKQEKLKEEAAKSGSQKKTLGEPEHSFIPESERQSKVFQKEGPVILSGKDALAILYQQEDQEGGGAESEEEEDESEGNVYQRMLMSGVIPDARMIHEAKKRRQRAREMGDAAVGIVPAGASVGSAAGGSLGSTADFVPLDKGERRRLIREHDEDKEDEDDGSLRDASGRLMMSLSSVKELERKERQRLWEESENQEGEGWEDTQLRKTGALLASTGVAVLSESHEPVGMELHEEDEEMRTVAEVEARLKAKMDGLGDLIEKTERELDNLTLEEQALKEELEELESRRCQDAQKRFTFYQETRSYVTDLIDCLNEKSVVVEALELKMAGLHRQRSMLLVERRRKDVNDENEVLCKGTQALIDKDRRRRIRERDGRRLRRKQEREREGKTDSDQVHPGWSSDEEEDSSVLVNFKNDRETILSDASKVFDDVSDDFATAAHVLNHFIRWKNWDEQAFNEAYVGICLPKIFAFWIRLEALQWNPLDYEESLGIESMAWFNALLQYPLSTSNPPKSDDFLISKAADRALLPKLTILARDAWDPMSRKQSLSLVRSLKRLSSQFPSINGKNARLRTFLETVVAKLKASVEHDVFIPLLSREQLQPKSDGESFLERQVWSAIKLFGNILLWEGIIGDHVLIEVGVTSLLNRYIMMAISQHEKDQLKKCRAILDSIPVGWFHRTDPISALVPLKALLEKAIRSQPSAVELLNERTMLARARAGAEYGETWNVDAITGPPPPMPLTDMSRPIDSLDSNDMREDDSEFHSDHSSQDEMLSEPSTPPRSNPQTAEAMDALPSSSSATAHSSLPDLVRISSRTKTKKPPTYTAESLRKEADRLSTFTTAPWPWPADHINPSELAKWGFFYLQDGRNSDRVQCVFCHGVILGWEPGDDPKEEHLRHFPNCAFMRQRAVGNVPLESSAASVPASTSLPAGTDVCGRRDRGYEIRPLSQPERGVGDFVNCFHCGGGLKNWEPNDDVWIEHAKWYPGCPFVLLSKGEAFVKQAIAGNPPPSGSAGGASRLSSEQLARDLEILMKREPAQTALELGIDMGLVREAISSRLSQGGGAFVDAQELIEAAFKCAESRDKRLRREENDFNRPPFLPTARALSHPPPPPVEMAEEGLVEDVGSGRESGFHSRTSSSGEDISEEEPPSDPLVLAPSNVMNRGPRQIPLPPSRGVSLLSSPKDGPTTSSSLRLTEPEDDNDPLREEKRRLEEFRLCKVCMDNEKCVVLLPCAHLCVCASCAPALKDCPICRELIRGTVKTYIS
ncbi:unnamed protein product [Cyprideis torosa]|uniref:Uncharacterized protein n=1 Tax=Cyprideis torosa TaxID=163714 RepID=A0A7R8W435_9CRUS|nr:unnamed protein product [Cyprideis torosa]CAG0879227.1 unnamed protein product [Cyprideis torosa]